MMGLKARLWAGIAALVLASGIPGTGQATTSCSNVNKLTVTLSTSPIDFGTYDPLQATDTDVNSGAITVTATCDQSSTNPFTLTYTVSLSAGNSSPSYARYMLGGPANEQLDYNLYTDSTRLTIWGDGTIGGTGTVTPTLTGPCQKQEGNHWSGCSGSQTDTVYGRITKLQNVTPGVYNDTVYVTYTY